MVTERVFSLGRMPYVSMKISEIITYRCLNIWGILWAIAGLFGCIANILGILVHKEGILAQLVLAI